MQTHVHWVDAAIQPSHFLLPTSCSCPQSFPASGSFLMSRFFASGGQSTGASTSASVLPMNIHGWFLLGLTGLISLLSKGLSRVFSSTPQFKIINSLVLSLLSGPGVTSVLDYYKNHSFDYTGFCQKPGMLLGLQSPRSPCSCKESDMTEQLKNGISEIKVFSLPHCIWWW